MSTLKKFGYGLVVATLVALAPGGSQATLTLQSGFVGGSGDVDNVVFNPCGPNFATQIGIQIQGCLNSSTTTLVNFNSNGTEILRAATGGGQARIEAQDGFFDSVQISLADTSLGFSKLQFSLLSEFNGTANFLAVDQFGTPFAFSAPISANGNNQFTLGSLDGQVAVSFTLTSTVGVQAITDLQQVRLGATAVGTCPNGAPNFPICSPQVEVPEPVSLSVFGIGLAMLGAVRMRRRPA
jgi:hypothetical protein